MNQKPTFIDNRSGNTLAKALAETLSVPSSESSTRIPDQLRIATAFFSPAGFKHISDPLKEISSVRLLLGADPSGLPIPDPKPLGSPEQDHEQKRIHKAWKNQILHLEYDRDQLPSTERAVQHWKHSHPHSKAAIWRCENIPKHFFTPKLISTALLMMEELLPVPPT